MALNSLRSLFVAALLLAAIAVPALADSWMPFQDKRVASPTGRTYVVIRSTNSGIAYELCRRAEGAAPMTDAIAADSYGLRDGTGGSIDRDPADTLVAEGSVAQRPLEVRVLDDPPAFVLFEKYGNVGHGDAVIYVEGEKGVVFRRKLADLFDFTARQTFQATVSSIWWHSGFVVDEERKCVLVVAAEDRLRKIATRDGEVSTPPKEVLLDGFRKGLLAERELCLAVAARLKPQGLLPQAEALAQDEGQPTSLRLRAAVAAKSAGGRGAYDRLFLAATEEGTPGEVKKYAIAHMGEMLGDDAMPLLRRLMRGEAKDGVWWPAVEAFVSLGEAAVPTLVEMMLEEGESADYRGGAAHGLGKIGSKTAVTGLLKAVETAPDYVANAAANAVIAIGAPDLGERLAAILAKGSTQDRRIAMYFREHPAEYARSALEAALARAKEGSTEARWIREALGALGGK